MPKFTFETGHAYERKDVIAIAGGDPDVKGGDWYTGYTSYAGVGFIFCNIASAGRTGHDYGNLWDGDELEWSGKTNSRATWDSIRSLTAPGAEVHMFYRNADRDPFTYAGLARPVYIDEDAVPVRIRWAFSEPPDTLTSIEAASKAGKHIEGVKKTKYVTTYERSAKARAECLKHYGETCSVCEVDFSQRYGDIGKGFMHVHHLKPVADGDGKQVEVDPVADLRPVCPNCHSMLHRRKPPLTIQELASVLVH
jgi:5-methylcytosine-specific restriction enzyme A